MSISYFWSIDKTQTLKSIPKELGFLLLPLLFMKVQISKTDKEKLLKYYSFSMVILVVFFLSRAIIRFSINQDTRAFFYHGENDDDFGLVPKLLNAIHVSVFVAVAFFYFFTKELKSKVDIFLSLLLVGFLILLSSKNIILVFIILVLGYYLYNTKSSNKIRIRNLMIFIVVIAVGLSFGKIRNRFQEEFRNNLSSKTSATLQNGVHNISIYEAWNNETFSPNDYFPGTAFRVYQIRMFFELLKEEPILLKGFGLNASEKKLLEKEKKYNLYNGYGSFNFHNQYIQFFAELGVIGLSLLLLILAKNIKNAINNKDFIHFSFAVLMISLFLTESFLSRQRGIVFFVTMYCIFNARVDSINSKS
ncbi:oligosaccharide repeat unit polymerase [Flavobacterium sp.]|uniref:oligosaccharide repeat unit polymerase n=1 Tax=Flavobacterium sp. TaxID=239 RepID=UPI0026363801|nr:oligosaccharide repeat unit polymerase [Flavobacterium sp.]